MTTMMKARLDKAWARVLCGKLICRGVLGTRGCTNTWLGDDGRRYRSPYYAVSLAKGYHRYADDLYEVAPRPKARLRPRQGRRPTHRRGAVGPTLAGTYVTGHLSPFGIPPEGTATAKCPRCDWPSILDPEGLHLVDWEERGDGYTIALPP